MGWDSVPSPAVEGTGRDLDETVVPRGRVAVHRLRGTPASWGPAATGHRGCIRERVHGPVFCPLWAGDLGLPGPTQGTGLAEAETAGLSGMRGESTGGRQAPLVLVGGARHGPPGPPLALSIRRLGLQVIFSEAALEPRPRPYPRDHSKCWLCGPRPDSLQLERPPCVLSLQASSNLPKHAADRVVPLRQTLLWVPGARKARAWSLGPRAT